jgi:hypothetical protein
MRHFTTTPPAEVDSFPARKERADAGSVVEGRQGGGRKRTMPPTMAITAANREGHVVPSASREFGSPTCRPRA